VSGAPRSALHLHFAVALARGQWPRPPGKSTPAATLTPTDGAQGSRCPAAGRARNEDRQIDEAAPCGNEYSSCSWRRARRVRASGRWRCRAASRAPDPGGPSIGHTAVNKGVLAWRSAVRTADALIAGAAAQPRSVSLRRVIFSDHAGRQLGEMPLETGHSAARCSVDAATGQVIAAGTASWSGRPSTADAIRFVIGRRACFGYIADACSVRWFSHPRVSRNEFARRSLDDRDLRSLLYDLHSDTLSTVSEIIWETSGPISVHQVPPHPAGMGPKARGWFDNCGIYAGYWRAIAQVLTG
jgi:hypothetical protein